MHCGPTVCGAIPLEERGLPYAGFSVIGPFASRLDRRLKCKGYSFVQLVSSTQSENLFLGPQGIHDWVKSFELLSTALVGFEAVILGTLLGYQGHITNY